MRAREARNRWTALSVAAQEGHVEATKVLLEAEVDRANNDEGRTALW